MQMTIYVFFPVALFYYFNRPNLYRELLEKEKVKVHAVDFFNPFDTVLHFIGYFLP